MKSTEYLMLLLGGNKPTTATALQRALLLLSNYFGEPIATSELFVSEAWGFQAADFLNQAVVFESTISPRECLRHTQAVEIALGRQHKTQNAQYQSRLIDIDIIFYGQKIVSEPDLQVPHLLMQERRFVLMPLAALMPQFRHPQLNKSIEQLFQECKDKSKVYPFVNQNNP